MNDAEMSDTIDDKIMDKIAEQMQEDDAQEDDAQENAAQEDKEQEDEIQEDTFQENLEENASQNPQENSDPDETEIFCDPSEQISADPSDNCEMVRMLEAILFASAQPISPQGMLERLPEGADLNVLLPTLKQNYEGRGIELIEIGGQWAFRTAQDVQDSLTIQKEVSKKLSKAALETLSIVAYHQPITRAEIENIRGVATHKGTLDILMELGWVKPGRRRESPGRPLTWVTTNGFLDHFQLENLIDLPGLDELKASGLLDRRAAIETIPDSGDLFESPDIDAEEVLSQSDTTTEARGKETLERQDEDAYDEQSYKEMKSRATITTNNTAQDNDDKGNEE